MKFLLLILIYFRTGRGVQDDQPRIDITSTTSMDYATVIHDIHPPLTEATDGTEGHYDILKLEEQKEYVHFCDKDNFNFSDDAILTSSNPVYSMNQSTEIENTIYSSISSLS